MENHGKKEADNYLISNSEVQILIEKSVASYPINYKDKKDASQQDLYTVEKEVLMYLKRYSNFLDKEKITECMKFLSKYPLVASEKLMLLNLQPKNIVELNPIIEDIDQRFTSEEQEAFIDEFGKIICHNPAN